jgi:hypothetical protein
MNKTLAWLCAAAALAGSVAYVWVNREAIIPVIETKHTDEIVVGMKDTLETVTARISTQDSKVKTEVRYVYEQTRTKVNALLADSVAIGLNDELARFRGLETGAGGMDDD